MKSLPAFSRFLALSCLVVGVITSTPAGEPSQLTENEPTIPKTVLDVDGKTHDIWGTDGCWIVLFFIGHECPVANRYSREIVRIATEYEKKKVKSLRVYPDPDLKKLQIEGHGKEFGLDLPAVHDVDHRLVKAVGALRTPEAVVINSRGEVCYRGRIDNLYIKLGRDRRKVTRHDLRDALDALLAHKKIPFKPEEAIGCYIQTLK